VSISKVDLPPPETPVTQVKRPSGIGGDVLQVVAARADDLEAARRFFGLRRFGHGDFEFSPRDICR
jgi:hypothetical protein